jgi:DNA-directed RNA polymerase specialized sigma24 family protein
MKVLSREKQIEVIAALCEGVGIRTASRLTGVNRGTVGSLASHAIQEPNRYVSNESARL